MKKFIILCLSFVFIICSSNLLRAGEAVSGDTEGALAVPADSVTFLPKITDGVTLSPSSITWSANLAGPLNDVTYGPAAYGGYPGGASGWVHSTYTIPSNGNYSLFFLVSDIYDEIYDSALAIDNIRVTSHTGITLFQESFEDGIPKTWTIGGHANVSSAVEGIASVDGNQFAFIDTVGEGGYYPEEDYYPGEDSTEISGYLEGTVSTDTYPEDSSSGDSGGVVDTSQWGGTSGTYLQSPTFWAEANSVVSFYANFLTNDGDGFPDFALVQLIDSNGDPVATLYTADASSAFVYGLDPEYPLLPEIVEGPGPFEFEPIQVNPDVIYYFDPAVAIGYEYYVSDNAFESVLLPDETSLFAGADNLYDLWLFNYSNNSWFDTGIDITGGTQFYFTQLDLDGDGNYDFPNGITLFRILGIDPRAGLDPTDPNAFVTGLTFVNAGTATVTQTPLATPEPSSILLLSAGLLIAGRIMRKTKKS